ncbi:MAG: flagellar biosynthesis protein FlhB [Deltaproteobacteria bacterium]|nr:flagellar biosynthesis protein FlhB [Candidatus Tharpella aukensis]
MAKDPSKTEKATGKKLSKSRDEGQVAKSQDVSSAFILIFGLAYLFFAGDRFFSVPGKFMRYMMQDASLLEVNPEIVYNLLLLTIRQMFFLLFPFMLLLLFVGLAANLMQVGFKITPKAMKPKLSKFNPISGFKSKFLSLKPLVELVKSCLKIGLLGYIAYSVYRQNFAGFFTLTNQPVGMIMAFIARVAFQILWRCGLLLLLLAFFDYLYQRWDFMENQKMSKQEVKDEMKQAEGDPQVKSRIRSMQMSAARQRMMQDVPRADVVITNPTHIAVALVYDQESSEAPLLVAKGAGLMAEKIKKIAREHDVPVVENKALARLLFKTVELNQMIPETLYQAVAEVLAYIYRRDGAQASA